MVDPIGRDHALGDGASWKAGDFRSAPSSERRRRIASSRSAGIPSRVSAETKTAPGYCARSPSAATSSGSASILLKTRRRGRSIAPIASSTVSTALMWSSMIGFRGVDHVEKQVRLGHLLEGGAEGCDEVGRKLPDEADGVGQERAACRRSSAKTRVVGSSVAKSRSSTNTFAPRDRVEEGGLARRWCSRRGRPCSSRRRPRR